jgi:hypothetical protein
VFDRAEAQAIAARAGKRVTVYGEDAVFAEPLAFGVADGVGGWNKHGVRPRRPHASLALSVSLGGIRSASSFNPTHFALRVLLPS